MIDWLIDWILFYVPLENILFMWNRYLGVEGMQNFGVALCLRPLSTGRDLYRATPKVHLSNSPCTTSKRYWGRTLTHAPLRSLIICGKITERNLQETIQSIRHQNTVEKLLRFSKRCCLRFMVRIFPNFCQFLRCISLKTNIIYSKSHLGGFCFLVIILT